MNGQSRPDESIERMLRESLGTPTSGAQPGPSCLDAEMMAAWMEGSLTAAQLAAAQAHAADCGVCRAALAALARTTPPTAAPEPWWRRTLHARWLVPVAATATAIAVWVAVPSEEYSRPPELTASAPAELKAADQPAATSPAEPAGALPTPRDLDASADARARTAEPLPLDRQAAARTPAAESDRAATLERFAPEIAQEPPAVADASREEVSALQQRADGARPDAAANPTVPPDALSPGEFRAEASTPAVGGTTASARPSAPPASAEAPQAGQAQSRGVTTLAERASVSPRALEVSSPDGRSRWRISATASVEFSADAGATWQATQTGVGAVALVAGTSPAGTICWIVGRTGTVLLTTDGRQWRRLPAPAAVDLVAVEAIDARTATVTTADGRRFQTVDAGASWK